MHVAITAHFWGRPTTGSGQYLHRLVEAFRRDYPSIRITLLADRGAAPGSAPPGIAWYVVRTPFDGWHKGLSKLWFEQVAAPRAAAASGADLLHVPYFAPPLTSALPTIATVHDLIPMILPAYRGNPLVRAYTTLVARTAPRVEHLIADSDASRHDILRLLAVSPERVSTIYLGVDSTFRAQPPAVLAATRARYGLPEQFALYLGGFDQRKNVPLLLEALQRSHGKWPLVIAGRLPEADNAFSPDPRRVARALGVEERVYFTGWVDEADKPSLLGSASLFVFPSQYEGFGLPLLEAMACGTATVTSNVSSLPEVGGDAAAFVPPNDAAALSATLDRLMADGTERARLASLGVARARAFSWERCASETVACYRRTAAAVRL